MHRPFSIVRFERLYLAALALDAANATLNWSSWMARFTASPAGAEMTWVLPAMMATLFALRLALWYFVAQRASVVAKWIVVALAVISGIGLLSGVLALITGAISSLPPALAGIAAAAFYIAAAVHLFRPDTRSWFGNIYQEHDA